MGASDGGEAPPPSAASESATSERRRRSIDELIQKNVEERTRRSGGSLEDTPTKANAKSRAGRRSSGQNRPKLEAYLVAARDLDHPPGGPKKGGAKKEAVYMARVSLGDDARRSASAATATGRLAFVEKFLFEVPALVETAKVQIWRVVCVPGTVSTEEGLVGWTEVQLSLASASRADSVVIERDLVQAGQKRGTVLLKLRWVDDNGANNAPHPAAAARAASWACEACGFDENSSGNPEACEACRTPRTKRTWLGSMRALATGSSTSSLSSVASSKRRLSLGDRAAAAASMPSLEPPPAQPTQDGAQNLKKKKKKKTPMEARRRYMGDTAKEAEEVEEEEPRGVPLVPLAPILIGSQAYYAAKDADAKGMPNPGSTDYFKERAREFTHRCDETKRRLIRDSIQSGRNVDDLAQRPDDAYAKLRLVRRSLDETLAAKNPTWNPDDFATVSPAVSAGRSKPPIRRRISAETLDLRTGVTDIVER